MGATPGMPDPRAAGDLGVRGVGVGGADPPSPPPPSPHLVDGPGISPMDCVPLHCMWWWLRVRRGEKPQEAAARPSMKYRGLGSNSVTTKSGLGIPRGLHIPSGKYTTHSVRLLACGSTIQRAHTGHPEEVAKRTSSTFTHPAPPQPSLPPPNLSHTA